MSDDEPARTLCGISLSPGWGEGNVFVYPDLLTRFDEFCDIDDEQIEEELKRLDLALEKTSDDLSLLANRVEEEIDVQLSDVFRAHLTMMQDPSLRSEVEKEIKDELVSAGSAVWTVFRRWERRFRSMEAEVAAHKGDDMRDLARRLISALAGVHAHALENIPRGSVLVANRLLPSDTVFLARNTAAAALLEVGGKGSHAALFAREIGLPCVAGLPDLLNTVSESSFAIVDADECQAIINPTTAQKNAFQAQAKIRDQKLAQARAHAHEPAVTMSGKPISVFANVGDVEDTLIAVENGADGVGLYRLEQAYLGRQKPPNLTELLAEMQRTLQPARGMPVFVRLLDVGADKPLLFVEMPTESNPALGLRGIRFLWKHPELLHTQLDALINISSDHDLHILVPMVALPNDMLAIRLALKEAAARANIAALPKLGAMIETPAAALAAPDFMKYADFLSFGTNDLTQYAFAADRENAAVDSYFDDTHDVIFRLISMVHNDVPDAPLSICGELAGRTEATSRLIECGVTSLGVAPPSIPMVKEAVRTCGKET